jgi:hypothetical protein
MKVSTILATILIILFTGVIVTNAHSRAVTGKWMGIAPNGDEVTMIFYEDGSMIWSITKTDNRERMLQAKYNVRYNTKPGEIDIFDFNVPELRDHRFLGIIELRGTDKMLMLGRYTDKQENVRPKKFAEDAIEFTRFPDRF